MSMDSTLATALFVIAGLAATIAAFVFKAPLILGALGLISAVAFFAYSGRQMNRLGDLPPMKPTRR